MADGRSDRHEFTRAGNGALVSRRPRITVDSLILFGRRAEMSKNQQNKQYALLFTANHKRNWMAKAEPRWRPADWQWRLEFGLILHIDRPVGAERERERRQKRENKFALQNRGDPHGGQEDGSHWKALDALVCAGKGRHRVESAGH